MKLLSFLALAIAAAAADAAPDPRPVQLPEVPVEVAPPETPTVEPSPRLDIQEEVVLGSYETRYARSTPRGHNIELAALHFSDGIPLAPGDTLSFNETVGARTYKNGFWKAPIIAEGEMKDGDGGGVCQVSSTLHAAARRAKLAIVERYPHTRTMEYVTPGLDATVVYPSKDLKIRNDTSAIIGIFVTTRPDEKNKWAGILTVRIIGSGQVTESSYSFKVGPTGQSFAVRSIEKPDCTECPKKVQKGSNGKIVWSTLSFADGTTDTWRSAYPATDEVWELAPGQALPEGKD